MAKRETINLIIKTFKELGGNLSDVLGTRTNISFLGKGDNIEPFLDKNLNTQALGVLSQSKAVDEAKNAVGFAVGEKLNDIQANNLLTNLNKMKEFYMPTPVTNITDLATGTRNLDAEGLMSLRDDIDLPEGVDPRDTILPSRVVDRPIPTSNDIADARLIDDMYRTAGPRNLDEDKMYLAEFIAEDAGKVLDDLPASKQKVFIDRAEKALIKNVEKYQDLPPPGSRGGPEDIAAPVQSAEETIANLKKQDPEIAAQFESVFLSNRAGVPAKRANAREFLVEALKKDTLDPATSGFGKTNLSDVVSAEDVKFITEGGGGIGGDPLVLVEKYFGPRIVELIPDEKITPRFINRLLTNVRDAAGRAPDDPRFDRFTATLIQEDIPFAKGGLAKILEV